jgi:predicted Fe-Mo cluster-binding NifX family protein
LLNKENFRIAVATNGKKGLKDKVSQVFGRANAFTIVDVEEGEIQEVKVIENPAMSYKHGAGPIVVKELVDSKVDLVVAPEFGPGASSILEQHGITMILAKVDTKVAEAIEDALKELRKK